MATEVEVPRVAPKERMTFQEFHDWCDEDTWAEWVNGRVALLPRVSWRHQDIVSFLLVVMGIYVEERHIGRLLPAPFLMRLTEIPSARMPDLIFAGSERVHLFKETYFDGPPDALIEVTTDESIVLDRGEKFVEYERAGIKEYWLIDPDRQSAEFYELSPDGRYRLGGVEGGIYRSKVIPAFWLRVEWLWQSPAPQALSVLRELKII